MGDRILVGSSVTFDHGGDMGNVLAGADSPENIFTILEELEKSLVGDGEDRLRKCASRGDAGNRLEHQSEPDAGTPRPTKKAKVASKSSLPPLSPTPAVETGADGQQRMSHITVERNRRKQMNEHLSVLRSLMPCFYVKRGDQASIIGGVVDFIKELQQLLQSLEAKKQRIKVYTEVLSPRPVLSPRLPCPVSPRLALPPPHSPRLNLPISPRTPQPTSPYKTRLMQHSNNIYLPPTPLPAIETPPPSLFDNLKELAANSKSPVAEVEVKFSGANVLLKTVSHKIPGQATKIVAALEGLSLEILNVSISVVDDTMLNSFTIKIGIECELSAEELAHEVQLTFS